MNLKVINVVTIIVQMFKVLLNKNTELEDIGYIQCDLPIVETAICT